MPKLVSVGMPAYNAEGTIEAAITSILDQDYERLELVVSDNASTDRTETICRGLASKDPRIVYRRQEANRGVHNNYNAVFKESQGVYFKWASSNDWCHPTFISKCVATLEAHPEAVVSCPRTVLVFGDGTKQHTADGLNLTAHSPVARYIEFRSKVRLNNVMNGVMRADALRKTSLYRGFVGADVNMMAELALMGTFIELDEALFFRSADPKDTARLKSLEDAERYYRPMRQSPMRMQVWASDIHYLARALRAPISLWDRARLIGYNLREMVRHRNALGQDVAQVLRSAAS